MQVYLVERLDADREDQLLHMKVCARMKPMQRPAARCRLTSPPPLANTGTSAIWLTAGPAPSMFQCWPDGHVLTTCALQAVCFLRPTRENCARIRRELRDPRYGQYFLCERVP